MRGLFGCASTTLFALLLAACNGVWGQQNGTFDRPDLPYFGINFPLGFNADNSVEWYNASWRYRVPITFGPAVTALTDHIAFSPPIDFQSLIAGDASAFDPSTIRLIEYSPTTPRVGLNSNQFIPCVVRGITPAVAGSTAREVVFLLPGATAINQTRTFQLYFDTVNRGLPPAPTSFPSLPSGPTTVAEYNATGATAGWTLENTLIRFRRGILSSNGVMWGGASNNDPTKLSLVWKPTNELLLSGMLLSTTWTNDTTGASSYFYTNNDYGNKPNYVNITVQRGVLYSEISLSITLPPNAALLFPGAVLYERYRLYESQPYLEIEMWQDQIPGWAYTNLGFNTRGAYFKPVFDSAMVDIPSITYQNIDTNPTQTNFGVTSKYVIAYRKNSLATNATYGFYTFKPGPLRVRTNAVPALIFDSYAYAAGTNLYYRYLWGFAPLATTKGVFDTFKLIPPAIGDVQTREMDIIVPPPTWLFIGGDAVAVSVVSPIPVSSGTVTVSDSTGTVLNLNGAPAIYPLSNISPYQFQNLLLFVVNTSQPTGTYTLTINAMCVFAVTPVACSASTNFSISNAVHPSVFVNSTLLAAKNYAAHQFWPSFLTRSDATFIPKGTVGQFDDIRSYQQTLEYYAFAGLVTRNPIYCKRAWGLTAVILTYDWRLYFAGYDLIESHLAMGLSLTYDWCFDQFNATQREAIRSRVLVESAFMYGVWAGYKTPTPGNTYYNNNHGWINNCACATVAYVFRFDRDVKGLNWTARAQSILDSTNRYFAVVHDLALEHDGSNHEGAGYWAYGLQYQVRYNAMVDFMNEQPNTIRSPNATVSGFVATPYYANTIAYRVHVMMPEPTHQQVVNIADVERFLSFTGAREPMWKLASVFKETTGQWLAATVLDFSTFAHSVYEILWFDPTVAVVDPVTRGYPVSRYFADIGTVIQRSSFDSTAVLFAFKSSQLVGGHDHPDANHFLITRGKDHLIVDDGYVYRKQTVSHNTFMISGFGQFGDGQQFPSPAPAAWVEAHVSASFVPRGVANGERPAHTLSVTGEAANTYRFAAPLNVTRYSRRFMSVRATYFVVRDAVAVRNSSLAARANGGQTASTSVDYLLHTLTNWTIGYSSLGATAGVWTPNTATSTANYTIAQTVSGASRLTCIMLAPTASNRNSSARATPFTWIPDTNPDNVVRNGTVYNDFFIPWPYGQVYTHTTNFDLVSDLPNGVNYLSILWPSSIYGKAGTSGSPPCEPYVVPITGTSASATGFSLSCYAPPIAGDFANTYNFTDVVMYAREWNPSLGYAAAATSFDTACTDPLSCTSVCNGDSDTIFPNGCVIGNYAFAGAALTVTAASSQLPRVLSAANDIGAGATQWTLDFTLLEGRFAATNGPSGVSATPFVLVNCTSLCSVGARSTPILRNASLPISASNRPTNISLITIDVQSDDASASVLTVELYAPNVLSVVSAATGDVLLPGVDYKYDPCRMTMRVNFVNAPTADDRLNTLFVRASSDVPRPVCPMSSTAAPASSTAAAAAASSSAGGLRSSSGVATAAATISSSAPRLSSSAGAAAASSSSGVAVAATPAASSTAGPGSAGISSIASSSAAPVPPTDSSSASNAPRASSSAGTNPAASTAATLSTAVNSAGVTGTAAVTAAARASSSTGGTNAAPVVGTGGGGEASASNLPLNLSTPVFAGAVVVIAVVAAGLVVLVVGVVKYGWCRARSKAGPRSSIGDKQFLEPVSL